MSSRLFVFGIIFLPLFLQGQFPSDPSFEGDIHFSIPRDNGPGCILPVEWDLALNEYYRDNTVDLVTGACCLPAYEGAAYISLTCRPDSSREAIETALVEPLKGGLIYRSLIFLTMAALPDSTWDSYFYNGPAKLRIWGGDTTDYLRELLWTSPTVDHVGWELYRMEFAPKKDVDMLVVEVFWADGREEGYISMDLFAPIREGAYYTYDAGPDQTRCQGELVELIPPVFHYIDEAYRLYRLEDGQAWISEDPVFQVAESGTYVVESRFDNNPVRDTVLVEFIARPSPDLGADQRLCLGKGAELQSGYDRTYTHLWQDGSTDPFLSVANQSDWYSVIVTDPEGCVGGDSVQITYWDCEVQFEMPNVFTPNGDGYNDRFIPLQYKGISTGQFKVYDRWGRLAFTSAHITDGWDGVFQHQSQAAAGTYYWTASLTDVHDNILQRKGTVTLLK